MTAESMKDIYLCKVFSSVKGVQKVHLHLEPVTKCLRIVKIMLGVMGSSKQDALGYLKEGLKF